MRKIKDFLPLFYYFGKIQKLYRENSNNFLNEFDVNMADIGFLYYIQGDFETTQESLAKTMSVNEATVTRALKRLENKKFIVRESSELDKRKKIVRLTKKGNDITEIVIKKQEEFEKDLVENFRKDDLESFKCFLDVLLDNLENTLD